VNWIMTKVAWLILWPGRKHWDAEYEAAVIEINRGACL
jgi:hypothetical protein